MQKVYPIDGEENSANFTKIDNLSEPGFLRARKNYMSATRESAKTLFVRYCHAVIHVKEAGLLSIREAAYVIGNSATPATAGDLDIQEIIYSASDLQRHPSNYKASHKEGWQGLTKKISQL